MDMAKDESGNYKVDEVKKADASVKTMADFTSPDILYKELIDSVKKYHPSTDISMIEKAYHIADEAHKGQLRKSGEPYIIHPLCVAIILADLELDKESIVAGLLHDVVEDTVMTPEEIMLMNWLVDNVEGEIPDVEDMKDEAKSIVEQKGVKDEAKADAEQKEVKDED